MQADVISNFFNNPVTEDSVRALDSYIQEKKMDSKSIQSALELLLKPIPLNQGVNTLESWTGRIRDSNPKPTIETCELMYRALDALRFEKNIDEAKAGAHEADAHIDGLIRSNEVMNATIIKIGGLVAFFFSVTYAGYVISKSKGFIIRIFDKVIKNIDLDLMRFGRVGGIWWNLDSIEF